MAEEMKHERALKGFKNKSWFKSRRGGEKVTEMLDFPEMDVRKAGNGRKREEDQGKQEEKP